MTDLTDRLAALRPEATNPSDDTVAGDVRRGRRALRRRRAIRSVTGGALVLAIAGTTTAVVGGHDSPSPPLAVPSTAPSTSAGSGIRLVDYDGRQLPGFTVEKVPAGFVLQGATAYVLDIARPDDTSSVDDFTQKLVVTIEADERPTAPRSRRCRVVVGKNADTSPRVIRKRPGEQRVEKGGTTLLCTPVPRSAPHKPPAGRTVEVHGQRGTLSTNSEGTKTLRYAHGDDTVVIQMWPTLGLSDEELVEFADGVTVTADAEPSVG